MGAGVVVVRDRVTGDRRDHDGHGGHSRHGPPSPAAGPPGSRGCRSGDTTLGVASVVGQAIGRDRHADLQVKEPAVMVTVAGLAYIPRSRSAASKVKRGTAFRPRWTCPPRAGW